MADPLADVIAKAGRDWHDLLDRHNVPIPDLTAFQAAAVRAHLAAVLDAEEAQWMNSHSDSVKATVVVSFGALREALGVAAPTARDAEG